jgi:hypothetical protein
MAAIVTVIATEIVAVAAIGTEAAMAAEVMTGIVTATGRMRVIRFHSTTTLSAISPEITAKVIRLIRTR